MYNTRTVKNNSCTDKNTAKSKKNIDSTNIMEKQKSVEVKNQEAEATSEKPETAECNNNNWKSRGRSCTKLMEQ